MDTLWLENTVGFRRGAQGLQSVWVVALAVLCPPFSLVLCHRHFLLTQETHIDAHPYMYSERKHQSEIAPNKWLVQWYVHPLCLCYIILLFPSPTLTPTVARRAPTLTHSRNSPSFLLIVLLLLYGHVRSPPLVGGGEGEGARLELRVQFCRIVYA